ncbi:hypothetical protein BCR32DRAFT_209671, partial [Anaeromyces robustus]
MSECEEYDVVRDLNETKCNITFGQLLNSAPKLRTQVSQSLRLEKNPNRIVGAVHNVVATSLIVNNIDHNYISKNRKALDEDIAMVDVEVDGV